MQYEIQVEQLESEVNDLQDQLDNLEDHTEQIFRLEEEIERLQPQVESAGEQEADMVALGRLRGELEALRSQQSEIVALKKDYETLSIEHKTVQEDATFHRNHVRNLQVLLDRLHKRHPGIERNLIPIDDDISHR